jgi:hypothetical protein
LMSRLPHTLDVRLTDGGEVVSSMHAFMVWLGGLGQLKTPVTSSGLNLQHSSL